MAGISERKVNKVKAGGSLVIDIFMSGPGITYHSHVNLLRLPRKTEKPRRRRYV